MSSPRPWRCFSIPKSLTILIRVFSTSVEVFPIGFVPHESIIGLLHVRGGVSNQKFLMFQGSKSSPRPWRCFYSQRRAGHDHGVFSTSVEVFPSRVGTVVTRIRSSPRPWRCFYGRFRLARRLDVFSTSVEVFPSKPRVWMMSFSLLHVRGGVSIAPIVIKDDLESSPRPWRCFRKDGRMYGRVMVFSTSVEVFLLTTTVAMT